MSEMGREEEAESCLANITEELIGTEEKYVGDLNLLLDGYIKMVKGLEVLRPKVESLLQCNKALLEALTAEAAPGDASTSGLVDRVAAAFVSVAPFFKLYADYCRTYEQVLPTVASSKGTEFGAALAVAERNGGVAFDDLLIRPVQRLTKYPLFFEGLLKHVPSTAAEHSRLAKAHELVRAVSSSVNSALSDSSRSMVRILQPLGGAWLQLLAPHRQLVHEFSCTLCSSVASSSAVGYVITDALLVCKTKAGAVIKPLLLSPLVELLVGDDASEAIEAATDSNWPIPKGPHALRLAWDMWDALDVFVLELPTEEAARSLAQAIGKAKAEQVRLKDEMRERDVNHGEREVDQLAESLQKSRVRRRSSSTSLAAGSSSISRFAKNVAFSNRDSLLAPRSFSGFGSFGGSTSPRSSKGEGHDSWQRNGSVAAAEPSEADVDDGDDDEAEDSFHELQRTSAFSRKNSRGSGSPAEPQSPVFSSPGMSEPGSADSQVNIKVSVKKSGSVKGGMFNRGARSQSNPNP